MLLSEENSFNDFSIKSYSKKIITDVSEEWHSAGNTVGIGYVGFTLKINSEKLNIAKQKE